MLWGHNVLAKLEDDLNRVKFQFISVDDLLELLISLEKTSKQKAAQWLILSKALKRTKSLIFQNGYLLSEYDRIENPSFCSPIKSIQLIADGELAFDTDIAGFARLRLLNDLKSKGLNISQQNIDESIPFITTESHQDDDNFYKNQCIDLIKNNKPHNQETHLKVRLKGINENYARLLSKDNPSFNSLKTR